MLDAETAVMVHNIYMRGIYNGILSIALAVWIGLTCHIVERVILFMRLHATVKAHKKVIAALDDVRRNNAKTFGN